MGDIRLSYQIPKDLFVDNEKVFSIFMLSFTKRNLIGIGLGLLTGGFLTVVLTWFTGRSIIGIIITILLVIFMFVITTVRKRIEEDRYKGGGNYLYEIIVRKIYRRLARKIYIKALDNPNEEAL